jgi:hypothetical protein
MRFLPFALPAVFLTSSAFAALTTTLLPDPFPNEPPFSATRSFDVERNSARRTPSAILNVYDVENDTLSASAFTQPAHGSVASNGDGTFTYTPALNYTGADSFAVTVSDGRGGTSTTTMQARVIVPPTGVLATRFVNFAAVQAAGADISLGSSVTTMPRAIDWDRDGDLDLIVGAQGGVQLYLNTGTAAAPVIAAPTPVQAGGTNISAGTGRVCVAWVDFDGDGVRDLAVGNGGNRNVRFYRTTTTTGPIVLAASVLAQTSAGATFVADDVRMDVADWNGDGMPDVITGSFSGNVKVAYGTTSSAAQVRFAAAEAALDTVGTTISGSYNLSPRVTDLSRDGVPDLLVGYNWGNIDYYANTGTSAAPVLDDSGSLGITAADGTSPDLHALTDGPLTDFADFNGDGVLDIVFGGSIGGKIHLATGVTAVTDLNAIVATVAAHPADLGIYLEGNATAKAAMQAQLGRVYDFVAGQAAPSQLDSALNTIESLITSYPQYFRAQTLDTVSKPKIASLASMIHLTMLVGKYYDPAHRTRTANAAQMTGAYRKLCEDIGLLYMENFLNPNGAEAIWQWVRWMPRDVYPGTGITQTESLDSRDYNVRGHLKNTFAGSATSGGEYGFGSDAQPVIGTRGTENFLMTVVHHEATHDLDAYVNKLPPDFRRRWGQILVRACGRDASGANFVKESANGWYSESLTQAYWQTKGWWNGTDDWNTTLDAFFTTGPGAAWNTYGFMRGSPATFFLGAPQESLATQGNQYWNSGAGRIQVALDRWRRGYDTNITEVLHFMDVQSKGRNKMKLWENNDANDQVIAFAKLYRNAQGYIDGVDVNGRSYRFVVDSAGVVTAALPPDIAFATPLRSQVSIPSGVGLWLSATVTPLNNAPVVTTAWSLVNGPGTAIFDNANAASTGVTFSVPGAYLLRCTASDGLLSGSRDITAQVGSQHMPAWTGEIVGNPVEGAGHTLVGGVYNIAAGGSNGLPSSGAADQFYFVHREFVGDGTLTARIVSVANVDGSNSRAGVMFRETIAAGAKHAFCGVTSLSSGRFIRRAANDTATTSTTFTAALPRWVRLVRSGSNISAYNATDNSGTPGAWSLIGTSAVTLNGIIEAGLAATSGSSSTIGAVLIDNVTLTPAGVNFGPAANAGADRSVPLSTTLTATATDDGFIAAPAFAWEKRSGPGTVTFGVPSGASTPATFSAGGAYTLRLYSDDGAVRTFDEAQITAHTPWQSWQASYFTPAELDDPLVSGAAADPERDGLANLIEYNTGLAPRAASARPLTITAATGAWKLRFTRNLTATDATLTLMSSTTLAPGSWQPVTDPESIVSEANGTRTVEVTVTSGDARRFFRLEAALP